MRILQGRHPAREHGRHGGFGSTPSSSGEPAPSCARRTYLSWRRCPQRFLRSIGYYGLVELEYKLDRRDGQIKLLDVNARTWGYHSLGQRAGVDFPYLLYADQVGLPAPDGVRAAPEVTWIRLTTDIPTAALEFARRRLDWRAYLRSLRAPQVESVFSRDDLRPGLAELALLPYLAAKRGI